jgi:arginine N-succinyltransferase
MAIGMAPKHFDPMVIAQVRGCIKDNGNAPFWESICQKFCPISYQDLDMHLRKSNQFLIDLLPQIPLYVHMMPEEIQSILGQTHPNTQSAAHMLTQEGFTKTDHIDIGDAGPILSANRDEIRIIRDSRKVTIFNIHKGQRATPENPDAVDCLLSVQTPTGVRITQSPVSSLLDHGIGISTDVARNLGVGKGQQIWIAPIKSHPFMRRFSEWFTTLAVGQTTRPSRDQASHVSRLIR